MKWISPNESLPENGKLVLVAQRFGNGCIGDLHLGYFLNHVGWDLPYYEGLVNVCFWSYIDDVPEEFN